MGRIRVFLEELLIFVLVGAPSHDEGDSGEDER
jgi:hypothetical protein